MINYRPIIQKIPEGPYHLDMLRLDLIHPDIGGNKWFKLRYNLEEARKNGSIGIVTAGGAHSNHIAATAAACELAGLKSAGLIRGEKPDVLGPTLTRAREQGMILIFVNRATYNLPGALQEISKKKFPQYSFVPEGGSNIEGIRGCAEIIGKDWQYDYICCACGTATTFAGLVIASGSGSAVVGINVLKGKNELSTLAEKMINAVPGESGRKIAGNEEVEKDIIEEHCITDHYALNGYAAYDPMLVDFKKHFEKKYSIPLDHVYTSKLVFGVFDLIEKKKFRAGSKILLIHSGGLQGNQAFEDRYHLKLIR